MKRKSFLNKILLRGGICLLLAVAMVLGVLLPGVDLERAEPENPLAEESVREINVLSVGENISQMNTIVVPSGGSASPLQPKESDSAEPNSEESIPENEVPEEMDSEEPDVGDGEEGNDDGRQGEEGGQELDLELAAVMTWYKYGKEAKTIVCSPGDSVAKTLNTAQLKNNELHYEFSLEGADAKYVDISSVSLTAGDTAAEQVGVRDSIEIQLPGGVGNRNYSFKVTAVAEIENEQGEEIEQEISFVFTLRCEYTLDLELNLSWKDKEGLERTVVCGPDKASAFSVRNYDLEQRNFVYTATLSGVLAEDAKIISASYTTASGQRSGNLEENGGTLLLEPEPGTDKDTYYLNFTVKTPERTVLYTYNLAYQESLDAKLLMNWEERNFFTHILECRPGAKVQQEVRNNQLTAGAIPYSFEFAGDDTANARIVSISYVSDDASGVLGETGTLPMTLPEGGSTNTYNISVSALVKGQRMNFEYVLKYSNDVSLQMEYSIIENEQSVQRVLVCENGKSKTAENIYDDQLDADVLSYKMTISGSDAEYVSISSVKCYQSGSGRNITLREEGDVTLLTITDEKTGAKKTGENSFNVVAKDADGNEYKFSINIPYKPRGGNNIQIETNLDDTKLIPNGTKTNLTVKAWRQDEHGNVIDYIPANGTDTKLTVTFDGEELTYTSSSGASSEYDLFPENPEEGDINEHTLHIYAEDASGNYGEKTIVLIGEKRDPGQKIGTATIKVDMTVLGLGIVATLPYDVLAFEPISYVIAKALLGEDLGEPFGKAVSSLAWEGFYEGTLDEGFYLASLTTGHSANNALKEDSWPLGWPYTNATEEEALEAIDERFGKETGLATLWRCLLRNGLNKSSGYDGSFTEFDFTSGSGWMYSVGSSTYYPGQAMSAVSLQDGDVLTVRYTLAQGWDVGSGDPGYSATVGYCVSAIDGAFRINHQMVADENGVETCYCCGLVKTCDHADKEYVDQNNGTHILHCKKCNSDIGDWEAHEWPDADEDDESSTEHFCQKCNYHTEHRWDYLEETDTAECGVPGTIDKICKDCKVRRIETSVREHDFHMTSFYDADGHFVECFSCAYSEMEQHRYVYYANLGDFVCQLCYAQHNDEVCSDSLPDLELCQSINHLCPDCGYSLYRPAEIPHSYDDWGECEYCLTKNPNYVESD